MSATHHPESPLEHAEQSVARAAHAVLETVEQVLQLPGRPTSRWHRAGVTPRGERVFNLFAVLLVAVFAVGWSWSIAMARASADGAPDATAGIATALTDPDAPSAAFVSQAALEAVTPLRGASGKLRAHIQPAGSPIPADTLPAGAQVTFSSGSAAESSSVLAAPQRTGVWRLAFKVGDAIKPITDFSIITLKPFADKRRGRIGLYYIGNWPTERSRSRTRRAGYSVPSGFIEVTSGNQETQVSDHFRLRDFLTHDQEGIWPKYLVLDTKLVDKLELVLTELERDGLDVRGVHVMSGFRTPQYNASGGDPAGRAALSRHMFGDAADIFIDSDGDGSMDDLNRDGRVNMQDARVIQSAVDRVERDYPALVGGCGVYVAGPGHGPFTHIDTRGFRARWVGTGDN